MNVRAATSTRAPASEPRELALNADLSLLKQARDWAAEVARDFGLPEDDRFQVKLAMSEAMTNAIIHGSGSERDVVRLAARVEHGLLVFEVVDPGAGAEAERSERLADGGRGLELVGLVMDEVELRHEERGTVLRFAKRYVV